MDVQSGTFRGADCEEGMGTCGMSCVPYHLTLDCSLLVAEFVVATTNSDSGPLRSPAREISHVSLVDHRAEAMAVARER
eukprot:9468613-Pyramimonas_sp.AAC.1